MSGPRRLAVFLSVVWVALVLFVGWLNPQDSEEMFAAGLVGLALIWGLAWVVAGFRQKRT